MTERMFPIMVTTYRDQNEITFARASGNPFVVACIPWAMIAPHERQALRNHDQSLERLAERGGLDCIEALAVLDDKPYAVNNGSDNARLAGMVLDWYEKHRAVCGMKGRTDNDR